MVLLTAKLMQRVALFMSFGGLVCAFFTAFTPHWKTLNPELNEMENWYEGLWHSCIYQDEQGIVCKAFESSLALPAGTLASRGLMLASIATGLVAVAVGFFGLDGVNLGAGKEMLKERLLVLAGLLFWVSGIATLVPVSLVAYVMVVEFWDENVPDVVPRWEFGEGLFSGWFSGLILVVGGSLFFVAVCMGKPKPPLLSVTMLDWQRTQHYRKTEVL